MTGGAHDAQNSSGLLYRNEGNGQFTNVSVSAGIRVNGYSPISASWNDYDLDGFVDLLVCSWQGSPNNFRLLHNQGDGTFADATALLPAVPAFRTAYSHLWTDFDDDGWADCFVLVDSGQSILFKNVDDGQGGREFINVAQIVGYTNLGGGPMGIAAGDFDNDGDFDIGLSNTTTGRYYLDNGTSFQSITPFSSIWGWGVEWIDVDNDRDLDFYMAGSWSNGGGGAAVDKLFRNLGGGQFDDISQALNASLASSRHSVQVDYDNDGRGDLITVNPGTPGQFVSVYRNVSTTANRWLKVKVQGDLAGSNGSGVGAVVRIFAGGQTQVAQVLSGSSTTSTEDLRVHFGLGGTGNVDQIEVVWPRAGSLASRTDVFLGPFAVDQEVTLSPGCGVLVHVASGGCPGTLGVPTWTASGSFCEEFTVNLGPTLPSATGILGFSTALASGQLRGCPFDLDPQSTVFVPVTADADGLIRLVGTGPLPPAFLIHAQAAFLDGGATGGLVTSATAEFNGL